MPDIRHEGGKLFEYDSVVGRSVASQEIEVEGGTFWMVGSAAGKTIIERVVTISPLLQFVAFEILQVSVIVPPHEPGWGDNVEVTLPEIKHEPDKPLLYISIVGGGTASQATVMVVGISINVGESAGKTVIVRWWLLCHRGCNSENSILSRSPLSYRHRHQGAQKMWKDS